MNKSINLAICALLFAGSVAAEGTTTTEILSAKFDATKIQEQIIADL